MNKRIRISIVIITAITWLIAAVLFGLPQTFFDAARPFIAAISAASAIYILYDVILWRNPTIGKHIAEIPNLTGVWNVTLTTTWEDPETGIVQGPIQGFAQIDQSSSKFCMRIFTPESRSQTVAYSFSDDQGIFRLVTVYENKPDIHVRERDGANHQGSSCFLIRGYYPYEFDGEYWTEFKNVGTLKLSNRRNGEINSFEQGQKLE